MLLTCTLQSFARHRRQALQHSPHTCCQGFFITFKVALCYAAVAAPTTGISRQSSSRLTRPKSAGPPAADSSMGPPPSKPPRTGRMGGASQRAPLNPAFAGTGGADFVTILAPPAPAGHPASGASAAHSKASRKSVAGMPMRVPGPSIEVAAAESAPVAAGLGRRRTSVLPQRVINQTDSPPRHQLPSGLKKGASMPNSPDSVARSESSVGATSSVGPAESVKSHPHSAATR